MSIKVADNFLYQGRKPLDNRILIDTVANMAAMADAIIYDGMIAYVQADKKFYVYDSTNTVDPVLAKWRELKTGGTGNASVLEYAKNTDYKKDTLVYDDNELARVKADFKSDNTAGNTTTQSFELDITNNNLILIPTEIKFNQLGADARKYIEGLAFIINDFNLDYTKAVTIPETKLQLKDASSLTTFQKLDIKIINILNTSNELEGIALIQNYNATNKEFTIASVKYESSDIDAILAKKTYENTINKGQPNGYTPLGTDGKVPAAYLPSSLTSTYSKSEVDQKDTDLKTNLTTLINNEILRATNKENSINTDLTNHINNTSIHITQTEKDTWNAKLDASDLSALESHVSDTDIHVTQADKDKWNGMSLSYFVTNKTDLPMTGNVIGNLGYVQVSAPGVVPISCDTYIWDGTQWLQIDASQVSLQFNWGNILNKPKSSALAIDNTVNIAHSHTNKLVLDKIGQSASGNFTYDGVEIGVKVIFIANEKLLPTSGEDNTLYVVYQDSRVRKYPSISVWRDGAYQILGRGTQEAAPQVGDMSILQSEYFSVEPNTTFNIEITDNQFFSFMPVEILKEIEGAKNVEIVVADYTTPEDYNYNEKIINISEGHLKVELKDTPTIIDTVSDSYLSHVDIDLSDYKDITNII